MSRLPYWLTVALFAGLVLAKFDPRTGFTALLRFGDDFASTRLPALRAVPFATGPGTGYDGQFYAQIALDPALRSPDLAAALDAPAYRARRILAPAIAHGLGLGRPEWVLQAYALFNVACWAALALLLYREIGPGNPPAFARWFGCVAALGVLDSVRQALVDLPALLLLVAAVRSQTRQPTPRTAIWLAAGHLAKETNLLGSLALAAAPRLSARVFGLVALAALPLAAWIGYVALRLPSGQAGFGNFTWPFLGAIEQGIASLSAVRDGHPDSRHALTLLGLPSLFLQALVVARLRRLDHPWWRIGVAYALLLVVLGPWVWSGYWAACRTALPLTIAFNLLLPAGRAFWPLWVAGNITLLHGVWRFL